MSQTAQKVNQGKNNVRKIAKKWLKIPKPPVRRKKVKKPKSNGNPRHEGTAQKLSTKGRKGQTPKAKKTFPRFWTKSQKPRDLQASMKSPLETPIPNIPSHSLPSVFSNMDGNRNRLILKTGSSWQIAGFPPVEIIKKERSSACFLFYLTRVFVLKLS